VAVRAIVTGSLCRCLTMTMTLIMPTGAQCRLRLSDFAD
jgi:hypothetical protein